MDKSLYQWKEFDYNNIPTGATWDITIRYEEKNIIIYNVYFVDGRVVSWYDVKRDFYKKYPNFTISTIRLHKD